MTEAAPTLAAPDNDPYLWLEDIDGARATAWADEQTAATLARFGDERVSADGDTLRLLLDRPDKLLIPARRGGLIYNFWRDGDHKRGLWRRTTLESFRTDAPDWDVLVDLDALAAAEAEDWVWQGAVTLQPDHTRAMLRLSRGGSDAAVLREFDLAERCFVAGGFVLPEAKSHTAWLDRDTQLLSSALGGVTQSGYARTVRLWPRGTDPADAAVLFEIAPTSMAAYADFDRDTGYVAFGERIGFFDGRLHIGDRTGPQTLIDLPSDMIFAWHLGWLYLRTRTAWSLAGQVYPPDSVLVIRLDAFLAGARAFTHLFTPSPRQAVQNLFWAGDKFVLSLLDEAAGRNTACSRQAPGAGRRSRGCQRLAS